LLETSDVSVERKSNAHEQLTLAKGRAGYSAGAPTLDIRITNGVRAAGFEYDAGPDIIGLADVAFTIYAGNEFLTTTGTIMSDKFDKGVDKNANYELTISAKFANWQRQ
jgi:hypothetical protein